MVFGGVFEGEREESGGVLLVMGGDVVVL